MLSEAIVYPAAYALISIMGMLGLVYAYHVRASYRRVLASTDNDEQARVFISLIKKHLIPSRSDEIFAALYTIICSNERAYAREILEKTNIASDTPLLDASDFYFLKILIEALDENWTEARNAAGVLYELAGDVENQQLVRDAITSIENRDVALLIELKPFQNVAGQGLHQTLSRKITILTYGRWVMLVLTAISIYGVYATIS